MSKGKIKIGILSMSLLSMSALVITSAFGAIMQSFPDEAVSKIQMIGTIPSLGSLIITLLVGALATKLPKKILAMIGVAGVGLGGLLPIVFHSSVTILLCCAFILGIGLGFILTVIPMLMSMYFEGDERSSMMGANTAINALGSMVMIFVGAMLGAEVWHNTYYVFLITILIFFLVMLGLPLDKVEKAGNDAHGKQKHSSSKGINIYVYLVAILALAMSFLYTIYPSNLSIIIGQKDFGGTAMTGIVNALGTLGGLLAGFTINKIQKALKDKVLGCGFIMLAISFLLVRFAVNVPMAVIGSVCSGLAMAMVFATIPFYVSIIAAPYQIVFAMTIFQFLNSLGGIISPLVLAAIGVESGAPAFLFGAICCLVIGLVLLVLNFGQKALANKFVHE